MEITTSQLPDYAYPKYDPETDLTIFKVQADTKADDWPIDLRV